MMRFKVGDKVRIVAPWSDNKGMIGVVGTKPGFGLSIHVVIDETNEGWYLPESAELIEPDDSPDDTYVERDYRPDVRFPAFGESDNGMPHTPHYMNGLIETIDVIKMALTPEEFRGFLKGNVLKYELRAPYKHETPDEDYQKAKDYFNLLEESE